MKTRYIPPKVSLQNVYTVVRVSDCEPSPIQPPKRIDPKEIKNLEAIIRKTRQFMPIEVVENPRYGIDAKAKPFIIANGTRRWRVAQLLGCEYLDAVIIDIASANIAWLQRNGGVRPITGTELFYAWAACETPQLRAEALTAMTSPVIRDQIELFIRIIGEETAVTYGRMQKFSPSMAKQAVRFAHLSQNLQYSKKSVTAQDTLLWMLRHQTKRLIDDILRHENTNMTIISSAVKFIQTNEPCQWGTTPTGAKMLKVRPVASTVRASVMPVPSVPPVSTKKMAAAFDISE